MPSAEWHDARRREKLEAHQNKLPPEQRLVNRTDWDDDICARVSVATARARVDSRRRFVKLAVEPTVGICDTPDQALAYFRKGGPPFTTAVMRKFAEAIAIASQPLLVDGVLSARSCAHTLVHLWSASKAAGNPVHRDVKQATLLYVYGPLVTRGLIHTTEKEKVTAVPEDISAFVRMIFTPRFAVTLASTRELLLLALFICLQVDCSSRVSELVMPSMTAEDMRDYEQKHPEKMFRWKSVEVFAFQNEDGQGGRVTLRARLTFRGIKDVKNKGFRVKTIPLRLLPPSHVAEDSLFWLVTLGLIDGVFANVRTWHDIDQMQPGEKGMLLPVKPACLEAPVFRSTKYHATVGDDLVNKKQMNSQQILDRLHRLSWYCGLRHAMLPNVLRRSSAYLLANTTTPDERKARMGHSENSSVYWGSYRNTTSTVDFQALRFGIAQQDVAAMSSIFLNTSPDDRAPAGVSDAGMTQVLEDPDLVAVSAERSELLDELLLYYGSLDAARAQSPARHGRYKALQKKHTDTLQCLMRHKYREEYTAWCAERWQQQPQPGEQAVPQPPTTSDGSMVDELLDESQQQDDWISCDTEPIDPRLLEEAEAEAAAAAESLAKGLEDVTVDGEPEPLDVVQEEDSGGIETRRPAAQHSKSRKFVKTDKDVPLHTLVDSLPNFLYSEPDQNMTWAEISAVCTTAFNHLHGPGRFYPNQEPLPGTWDCRFCGMSLLGEPTPEYHSLNCEATRLAENARQALPSIETGAARECPLGDCSSKQVDTPANFSSHVYRSARHSSGDQGARYRCTNHDSPILFSSFNDVRAHAITAHAAPRDILPEDDWHALIYLCPFCQVLISRVDMLEETHLQTHIDAGHARAIVAEHGLTGRMYRKVWVIPGFCIFCVYDTSLSLLNRFKIFADTVNLNRHVSGHVQGMTDAMPCPASRLPTPERLPQCDHKVALDATSMREHLEASHGFAHVSTSNPKKQPAKQCTDGVQEAEDGGPAKKMKKTGGGDRKPLGELDANQ